MSGDCWQADINWETLIIDSSGIPATIMLEEPEPVVAEPDVEVEPELPVVLLAVVFDESLDPDVPLEPDALVLESGTVVEAVVSLESLVPVVPVLAEAWLEDPIMPLLRPAM